MDGRRLAGDAQEGRPARDLAESSSGQRVKRSETALFASPDAGGESAGKRQTPRSTPNGSDHPASGAEIGRARELRERRQGAERTRTSARSVVPRSGDQTALCLDARVLTTAPPGVGVGEV